MKKIKIELIVVKCIIQNIYHENEGILNIAPGENKSPESFFTNDLCEGQNFSYLFSKGEL